MTAPFLKWAGGKRWIVESEQLPQPGAFLRYVEPFLGGGAVFFHLKPQRAVLSDLNRELIELYQTIRDEPDALFKLMQDHHRLHDVDYFYRSRSQQPTDKLGRAARSLYLNRTCWNGLYRVNLRGEFNVPIGTKSTVVFEGEDFREISNLLKSAEIRCSDFESIISETVAGDFLFVDPPYTVQHNMNGFVKYNERIFSWADQIRLRDCIVEAVGRGVSVAVTNADHPSIHALYEGDFEYRQLHRASVLAGKAQRRGKTTEALFVANL